MRQSVTNTEIGAEMLLSYLYPELEDKWIVRYDGTFYRNYSHDAMEISPEETTVWLSRDGILDLLPQGLLSMEDDLKNGDVLEKHKQLDLQRRILSEAFLPFDSVEFRRRLKVERNVSELLSDKLSYILRTFFGFDIDAEKNPYIREFAVLLPYVRHRRGDFEMIRRLLSAIFGCEVIRRDGRYAEEDSTRAWIPSVRFELLVPDLSAEEYKALQGDILPLRDFLAEWFIPAEVRLEILLKQHSVSPELGKNMILDYNTEL